MYILTTYVNTIQLLCALDPNFCITFFVVCLHNVLKKSCNWFLLLFIISTYFCYVTITLFICPMELRFLITLQFDMFELRMEITLQLCFVFALHCELFYYVTIALFICSMQLRFLITLELR